MNFSMISLGCSKNLVDSEMMMGLLEQKGYNYVQPEEAELIIINTCGFIEPAKEESIETILETAQLKEEGKLKYLIVAGCLVQRYADALAQELPEVDGFFGVGNFAQVLEITEKIVAEKEWVVLSSDPMDYLYTAKMPRKLATLPATAYVKVGDGCNNRCSYCAIPIIRGDYRERSMEDIVAESAGLIEGGVKEICLIAQDTTYYGYDLYKRPALGELCQRILVLAGLVCLPVLYLYPTHFSQDFIALLANHPKMCAYVDLPLQHCQTHLLKAMNRPHSKEYLLDLIAKLRREIPEVILRTSYIVGFPGETDEDVEALAEFIKETAFDHVGIFIYSPEEGTSAYDLGDPIPLEEKERRRNYLMTVQQEVVKDNNLKFLNREMDVLIEGQTKDGQWIGRTQGQSPDIDGLVIFRGAGEFGQVVPVKIDEIKAYDLLGHRIERDE